MSALAFDLSATSRQIYADALFERADNVEVLLEKFAGEIDLDSWQELNDSMVRLRAYATLMLESHPTQFLIHEMKALDRLRDDLQGSVTDSH